MWGDVFGYEVKTVDFEKYFLKACLILKLKKKWRDFRI